MVYIVRLGLYVKYSPGYGAEKPDDSLDSSGFSYCTLYYTYLYINYKNYIFFIGVQYE